MTIKIYLKKKKTTLHFTTLHYKQKYTYAINFNNKFHYKYGWDQCQLYQSGEVQLP